MPMRVAVSSIAYLGTSAAASDYFVGSYVSSQVVGAGYSNTAFGFGTVVAAAGGTGQVADLYDSPGNDTVTVAGSSATLSSTSPAYLMQANGFGQVNAIETLGGSDQINLNAHTYLFEQYGNWL